MDFEVFKCIETKRLIDEFNFPITLITFDQNINIFNFHYWLGIYIDKTFTIINRGNLVNNNTIRIHYPILTKVNKNFNYCVLKRIDMNMEESLWNCFNCKYVNDPEFIKYIVWLLTEV